jgi:hypothetical protein
MIIISFDNIIDVVSAKTGLIRLTNFASVIDLSAATYVPQTETRHTRINYKTDDILIDGIHLLIGQSLPLRLEILQHALTFSSEVANATGSFAVDYFCKKRHAPCKHHVLFSSPEQPRILFTTDPTMADPCPCVLRSYFPRVTDYIECRRRCDFRG